MSVPDALDAYSQLSKVIFGEKQFHFGDIGKYSAKKFEEVIKKVVAAKLSGNQDAKMRETDSHPCKRSSTYLP